MGRDKGNNIYVIFVVITYIIMSVYFSGFVHEYVHVLQYSYLSGTTLDEVCFMGIRSYDTDTIQSTTNFAMNNIMSSFGSIGGWVKFDGVDVSDYTFGIHNAEFIAYIIQIIFLLVMLLPLSKIWLKLM